MRVERIILEHHGDVAVLRVALVDDLAVDADLAARRLLQARDHAQDGALAAARWPDQHQKLLVGDIEVDAVDDRLRAERLAQLL